MNAAGAIPEYRKANKMPVCVIDTSDNNKDKQIDNLPLCKNCAAIIHQNQINECKRRLKI